MTTDNPTPDVSSTWSEQTLKIKEFMTAFGQPVRTNPFDEATRAEHVLRVRLVVEEALELADAAGVAVYSAAGEYLKDSSSLLFLTDSESEDDNALTYDPVEVLDALTDLDYVTKGARVQLGLPESDAFDEVHESNMSKLGEDGKPIFDAYGKVLKGLGYFRPNLKGIVEKYR